MKKKWMTTMFAGLCALTMLSGCSWMNKEKNNAEDAAKDVAKNTEKAGEKTKNGLDDVMKYLKGEGVETTEVKNLDNMDFAAQEGRSFMYNGANAYMYNINAEDEQMKALLKDAKEKKTVKVKQNGEEKEYSAMVNGNYLLVYDKEADMGDMLKVFPNYKLSK